MSDSSSDRSPQRRQNQRLKQEVGFLAEALVAQWLIGQGWEILQQRWHCRWGELDLVASSGSLVVDRKGQAQLQVQAQPVIAFVEVKARNRTNWDADGLLAITPQKREKLWQAAELFLADYPHLATFPCRFDVALVQYRHHAATHLHLKNPPKIDRASIANHLAGLELIELGKPVTLASYRMTLQHYLPAVFD